WRDRYALHPRALSPANGRGHAQAICYRGDLLARRAPGQERVDARSGCAPVQGEVVASDAAEGGNGTASDFANSATLKCSSASRSCSGVAAGVEHAFPAPTNASGAPRSATASTIARTSGRIFGESAAFELIRESVLPGRYTPIAA